MSNNKNNTGKLSFMIKLIKNNSGYSSKNFFLISITIIGLCLLIVPIFALCIEAWYNHTITTNLSDMAAYIGAVACIFASGGITKAWSEKYERYAGKDGIIGTEDDIIKKTPLFTIEDKKEEQ